MSDMHILVALPVSEEEAQELKETAPQATFMFKALVKDPARIATTPEFELTDEEIAAADIIIGNVPAARLLGAARLKWVQLGSAGADAYVKPGVLGGGCAHLELGGLLRPCCGRALLCASALAHEEARSVWG